MRLQGRNLSIRLRGEDVNLLHTELRQLGLSVAQEEADASLFGPTTEALIKAFQTRQDLRPTGIVDEATATVINREVDRLTSAGRPLPLVVRGRVVADDDAAAPGITVRAFDKDMRSETLLGSTTTDRLGRYEIRYEAAQFRGAEKDTADLIVRAVAPQDGGRADEVLAASDIVFNADPATTIDLRIDHSARRPSEFERHVATITPLAESVALADLTEADIDFLTGETGIDRLHLAFLATAHQHAARTRIAPEAFYAVFRKGLPSALAALTLQTPEALKAALAAALDARIVPAALRGQVDAIVAAFKRLRGERSVGGPDALPPVRILAAAGLAVDQQTAVLEMWLGRESDAGFWAALRASPLAAQAGPLAAALDLALLTGNNAALMEALAKRGVRNVQAFAALPEDDLKKTILESAETLASIEAADESESNESKASRLASGIRGLARVQRPGAFMMAARRNSARPTDRDVARVLANAPELDLRDADLARFLADNPRALDGVNNIQQTQAELRRMQRVLRLAPDATHAQALIDAGLDSAHAVAGLSAAAFAAKFGAALGGAEQARIYHARAQRVSDTVLAIAGAAQQAASSLKPSVLGVAPDAAKEFPDLATLFGAQDLCACQHCRSVLSPAAYLVDLLQFINPKFGAKPMARLRARRPDIEHVPLSCENTNTPLPYIDLTNEILEFYVANGALTEAAAHDTDGADPADLAVTPQFVLEAAYQLLESTVFPPPLPYQRPLETVRRYLQQLGTSRAEVMRTCAATDADVELESLGVAGVERDILVGSSTAPLGAHYGLPADPSNIATRSAAQLMTALGVDYDDLRQLLATAHLAPGQAITLTDTENPPRCNPEKIMAGNLSPQFWQRAHRFVRLRRKLGVGVAELDKMLRVLGGGDISVEMLRRIAQAERLHRELGLTRTVLLDFWDAAPPDPDTEQRRRAALAGAMRVGEGELDALMTMSGMQPFVPGDPGGLVALVSLLKVVRDSGLSIAQLAWLYRPGHPAGGPVAVPDTAILQLIRTTQSALQSLAAEATGGVDDPADLDGRLRDVVVQTVSDGVGLPAETTRLLMEGVIRATGAPDQFLMWDVLGLAGLDEGVLQDPAAPELLPARRGLLKLHKAAVLISTLGLSAGEAGYIAAHGNTFGGFTFDALPIDAADANAAALADWQSVAGLAILSGRLPQRERTLVDVFEAAVLPADANPRESALSALQAATQWNQADLVFLCGPEGYNLATATDFADVAKLAQLARGIALARRLGVAVHRVAAWAKEAPDAATADDVIAALQARYTPESWAVAGKAPRDTVREAQRDALVAYLLNHDPKVRARGITTADGLFEYFLIDTQMSACMDTSRIKQAISSVQLFIQRALMGLEDGVAPDDIDAAQWQWMRNYRVWEANRKVFLFPENWIEPDLRDDKTPFFRELESRLLQDDINFDTAEAAVERYLDQLHEVARLDIRALYVEEPDGDGGEEVVHVFGRTLSSPQAYYYRRLIGDRTWTPWEKIEAGIEGDHLLPLVANRRLYLFWLHAEERQAEGKQLPHAYLQSMEHWLWKTQLLPKWQADQKEWLRQHAIYEIWNSLESMLRNASVDFTQLKTDYFANAGLPEQEEPAPRTPEEPPFSSPPAPAHREITLCWSEYRNGTWSTKQSSSAPISSRPVMPTLQSHFGKEGVFGLFALGALNEAYDFVPKDGGGSMVETIFAVYLPSIQDHYLTGSVDAAGGRLSISVTRRYETTVPLLNLAQLTLRGHERIGEFEMTCGNVVEPAKGLDLMISLGFDQLSRPDATRNVAMAFAHTGSSLPKWLGVKTQGAGNTHQLAVTADGEKRVILGSVPTSGAFSVLRDVQHPGFRREPPYQDFVFQDDHRTYLASPSGEVRVDVAPGSLLRIPVAVNTIQSPLVLAAQPKPKLVAAMKSPAAMAIVSNAVALQPITDKPAALQVAPRAMPALAKGTSGALLQHMPAGALADLFNLKGLRFQALGHPHVCAFKDALTKGGLPGLFDPAVQSLNGDPGAKNNAFARWYAPTSEVVAPYPREQVDFGRSASALYNWELFFHVPMLIADALTRNQRFEEAMHWYHFIFDPTTTRTGPSPQRFWNCQPFFTNTDPERDSIQELLLVLAGKKSGWRDIADQIEDWRRSPFNPHLIARLRITAYQKSVVMRYIDNLIAWADQLFRRDTSEEINQATLLYVLAGEILGPRPLTVPPAKEVAVKTYSQLAGDLDAFSNALIDAEQLVPYSNTVAPPKQAPTGGRPIQLPGLSKNRRPPAPPSLATVTGLYFCPPQNEELLARWDTVADRLFKIRHCMNIEGVLRDLPLFEPPIDPALLVRATAAGIDLGSVLDDLYSGLPHYRFATLAQKASELCGEARALGAALLSALEKRDAEGLMLLRTAHERSVLGLMEQVRIAQRDEAVRNREALAASRETALARYEHYQRMLGTQPAGDIRETSLSGQARMTDARGVPMIPHEVSELSSLGDANDIQRNASGFEIAANIAHIIGDTAAAPMGVGVNISIGQALSAFASYYRMQAANLNYDATLAGKLGQAVLRAADNTLQSNQAAQEIRSIDKQMLAADVRIAICDAELASHRRQMDNARQVEDVLRDKFTSAELYNWMVSQTSSLYFQAYQLAYDMARRTERAWRHEIGADTSSFIRPGHWESLRKGLLAAERLHHDLKRMEAAYLEQNRREHELTKHVPLTQLDALAFVALKETGTCLIRLPEALFDMDHPGHYFRRLKGVSLSIPCVAGAYTSVNATLTLLKSELRADANAQLPYPKDENGDDPRFRTSFAAAQSIATSHAQNDSGLFELDFRDERYLPFEGAGAISEWRLTLPKDCNALDFNTISDAILHIKYTARDGGAALAQRARDATLNIPSQDGLHRLFSVRNEFSNDWYRFLHLVEPATTHRLVLDIGRERFPFVLRNKAITIQKLSLYLKAHDSLDTTGVAVNFAIGRRDPANPNAPILPVGSGNAAFTPLGAPWGNLLGCEVGGATLAVPNSLVLDVAAADLAALTQGQDLVDLMIVAEYSASSL